MHNFHKRINNNLSKIKRNAAKSSHFARIPGFLAGLGADSAFQVPQAGSAIAT
jgi:hypothetical protein